MSSKIKPVCKLRNWKFYGPNRVQGNVEGHPKFDPEDPIVTGKILRIETENTIYELDRPAPEAEIPTNPTPIEDLPDEGETIQ